MQAEARCRAAAVKIAGWYKRCIETRPARLTLKARRQLLPTTSLDRKKEEEQKAAAATAILELLKDIQRGQRFARAVKEFLCKVRSLSNNSTHQGIHNLCRLYACFPASVTAAIDASQLSSHQDCIMMLGQTTLERQDFLVPCTWLITSWTAFTLPPPSSIYLQVLHSLCPSPPPPTSYPQQPPPCP